jgi:low affinity Fe/Cu permease
MINLDFIFVGILLGLYIGVVPIFLGFFFLPLLQRLNKEWQVFVINISVGVLIFLLIDVSSESIELANKLIAGLKIPLDGKASVPIFDQFLFNSLGDTLSEQLGSIILLIGFTIGIFSLILVDSVTSKFSSLEDDIKKKQQLKNEKFQH